LIEGRTTELLEVYNNLFDENVSFIRISDDLNIYLDVKRRLDMKNLMEDIVIRYVNVSQIFSCMTYIAYDETLKIV
jgi:hypothetical protein